MNRILLCFAVLIGFAATANCHNIYCISSSIGKPANPLAIILTAVPYDSRIAQLNWTNAFEPGIYHVEREAGASGIWQEVVALPDNILNYSDTITYPYCISTAFVYRIRFEAATTIITFSNNSPILNLSDITNPANISNLLISLTASGSKLFPLLIWNSSPDGDVLSYEVNRYNGFSWDQVSMLPADSLRYVDIAAVNACDSSYSYEIRTFDRCNNASTPEYFPLKQNLKLNFPAIDGCDRLAKLSWNSYNKMPGGLGGYNIYRQEGSSGFTKVKTITDTTQISYDDEPDFQNGVIYTYYIEAFSAVGSRTSVSCQKSQLFSGNGIPTDAYITSVSVENNNSVRISYHTAPDKTVSKLVLERAESGTGNFVAIDYVSVTGDFVPQDDSFIDLTALVREQSYCYRLIAHDFCDVRKLESINTSCSILLTCSASNDQTQNETNWNPYKDWLQEVDNYKVFRTVDGSPDELQATIYNSPYTFTDPLAGVDPTSAVSYWVEAYENPGNPYSPNVTSLSNTCSIIKEAQMFLPNAFHPGGNVNYSFRPVQPVAFVDPLSFHMLIYNRWGQLLFETNEIEKGWDGNVQGDLAPVGLYVYVISYSSLDGKSFTKRGTVSLVQ